MIETSRYAGIVIIEQTVMLELSILNQAIVLILSKQRVQELARITFLYKRKKLHHFSKVHFGMKCF